MPQLGQYQYLLDTVFFLYPDEASALAGSKAGGTGFFITVPSANYPEKYHHVYGVTNWHVAVSGGNSVIRVNKLDGTPLIFEFGPDQWEFLAGGHDVAVVPVNLNPEEVKVEAIVADSFLLTPQQIKDFEINAAEDVFMLGRFIDWDGEAANQPAMRFGNISIMEALVPLENGATHNSLVVDMHSRTGFSGSPVFVYRTSGSIFPKEDTLFIKGHMMKLLGILWGVFPELWDIHDKEAPARLLGQKIKGLSGMSLVAPAHTIWATLNSAELQKQRAEVESRLNL